MKFISLSSAKGIEIDQPIYTLNDQGEYGLGKCIRIECTAKGTVHTFENVTTPGEVSKPVTNITHVAIVKNGTSDGTKEKNM